MLGQNKYSLERVQCMLPLSHSPICLPTMPLCEGGKKKELFCLKLFSPLQHRGFVRKMKHRKRYSDNSQRYFVLH